MQDFFVRQMDGIYFVYGLVFFLLAAMSNSLGRTDRSGLPWRWLRLFGTMCGLHEWSALLALSAGADSQFEGLRTAWLALSFLPLVEFARAAQPAGRRPGAWLHALLLLAPVAAAWSGVLDTELAIRLSPGLAGVAGAALALTRASRHPHEYGRALRLAALGMSLYALVSMVLPSLLIALGAKSEAGGTVRLMGVPSEAWGTVALLFVALSVWKFLIAERLGELYGMALQHPHPRARNLLLTLAALLAGGILLTDAFGRFMDGQHCAELVARVRTAALAFPAEELAALHGDATDVRRPEYVRVCHRLDRLRRSNPDFRAAWIVRSGGGGFFLDAGSAETVSSAGFRPGKRADGAPGPEDARFVETGVSHAGGPVRDRWGESVFAVAPLSFGPDRHVHRALRVEVDAADWMRRLRAYRLGPLVFTLLASVLAITLFTRRRAEWKARLELALSESRYRELSADLERRVEARTAELQATSAQLQEETERHRNTVDALRRNEQRMRAFLDAQPDMIFRLRRDSTCLDYRASKSAVLLLPPETFVGRRFSEVLPPSLIDLTMEKIEATLRTGDMQVFPYSATVGSEPRLFEARMVASGEDEVVLICRDVTEQRRLQEEQLRAHKLESLGLLAGGIAHDFNNILLAILGNLQLARMQLPGTDGVAEVLEESEKACLRARDLTQQLITFASGGAPVKRTISVSELLRETVSFSLSGSKSACEFEFAPDLWPVDADPGQISRVIHNLVVNADQSMPQGGRMTVRAANVELALSAALPLRAGRYVTISVEDEGVGIPPENIEKIFLPYFTTKDKHSGLGLAGSFSIVKKHGGHITVDSQSAKGSIFRVYLPASTRALAAATPPAPARVRRGGRILIMDDEISLLKMLERMLDRAGYRSVGAKDGAEAIRMCAEAHAAGDPFDVAILDLTIPGGMGGREAMERLRRQYPGLKGIVSTGYSSDPIMENWEHFGFSAIIAKPYEFNDLIGTIDRVRGSGSGA